MKPEDKQAWVDALRSGDYKQCKGKLHDGEGFCCLGVAADIFEDDWWVDCGDRWKLYNRRSAGYYRPPCVSVGGVVLLSDMNDRGKNFDAIADWIEANL